MMTDPQRLLARKVHLARAAIFLETLWRAVFPPLMIVGAVTLAVLTGLLAGLPAGVRFAAIGLAGLAFLWSLRPVLTLSLPSEAAGLRRVELMSELRHRPATAWRDRLSDPRVGPESRLLWQEHRARMAAMLSGLRVGWPRSPLPARDPLALRNALAIALLAAFVLNLSQWRARLDDAMATEPRSAVQQASLDAWIVPPAYTRKPPVLLTGPAAERRQAREGEILVPEASTLVVRLNGADSPQLSLAGLLDDGSAGEEIASAELKGGPEGVHETKMVLDRPVHVSLSDGSRSLAEWRIALVPDAPPRAEIDGPLSVTPTGGFAVNWKASDDYGVAGLGASIGLNEKDAAEIGRSLLYDPPSFSIALPRLNPREAQGRAFQDLTAHPWAGLTVDMRLIATDQAGQKGESDVVTFKLPERQFRKLLARALVEQRRNLVRSPADSHKVVKALSALMAWPDGLIDNSGHYLGIRTAASRLYQAKSDVDKKAVVELLWEIAVSIEDGDLSDALRELEALRRELQQALAEGAPPERIAELMDQLRQALDRYLEAMARQLQEALRRGELEPQMAPGREIQAQDLQRMLDMIENLAKSGARDAAQELLAQLENLLRNMQPGIAGQMDSQRGPLSKMMQELGQLMRRQQQLMDETFRLPEGLDGMQPLEDGAEPGARGNRERAEGLAGDQEGLGRLLEELMRQLGQQGLEAPQSFGRAQREMEGAAGSLRGMQRDRALGQQGEALEALREGAQSMAQQLMQQGTGSEGNYGRHGEARGDDRDPLGRPMPHRGEDYGPDYDMVPGESAIERAREILEYLRSRANERGRPRIELDYLERLLRGLY